LKLSSLIRACENVLIKTDKPNKSSGVIVKFLINQIVTVVLLAVSLSISLWFFTGITAGVLLVPAAIFINNITEILGITKNNFE
jgi:hypothetical protein